MDREQKLAKELAKMSNDNFLDGNGINGTVIDYKEYFNPKKPNEKYDIEILTAELKKIGYKLIPLEKSSIRMMPLKGKYVVEII